MRNESPSGVLIVTQNEGLFCVLRRARTMGSGDGMSDIRLPSVADTLLSPTLWLPSTWPRG
jgi:hypothetical protein